MLGGFVLFGIVFAPYATVAASGAFGASIGCLPDSWPLAIGLGFIVAGLFGIMSWLFIPEYVVYVGILSTISAFVCAFYSAASR